MVPGKMAATSARRHIVLDRGPLGIGLVAALYATRARTLGPVAALHTAGLVLVAIAAAGALGALALSAVRNTALARD